MTGQETAAKTADPRGEGQTPEPEPKQAAPVPPPEDAPEVKLGGPGNEEKEKDDVHVSRADKERARQLSKLVPIGFVNESLEKSLQSRKLMSGLILYIAFIILFVFYFLARRDMEAEYYMTNSLKDLIYEKELPNTNPTTPDEVNQMGVYFKKVYDEIGNYGDIYDYVETILIPQLFVNPPLNTWERRLQGQNIPIGSLRIRAKHVHPTSCDVNAHFYPENRTLNERICFGKYSPENEKKDPIVGDGIQWNWTNGCSGWPFLYILGQYANYDCSSFNVDMPFNMTLQDALTQIATLRPNNFFLVTSIRLVSFEMFTYNPPLDAFTSAKLFIEITPAGGFIPQARFRAFRVHNPNDKGWAFYYIFFAVVVTMYLFRFIQDWVRFYRLTRRRIAFLFDVWNLLELVNLTAFYITFGFVFYWWKISVGITWTFPYRRSDFPLDLASLSECYFWSVYFNALNTVIVFLKILKYLRLNSRLNILQRTIESAAQSIIGVLIVFCLVVLSYALAGFYLYGTGLWSFRRVDEAFAQLFRSLIGQFDYGEMRDFNRALTFVYFWSFTFLGLFVCLNFIIAVIMTGFDEETEKLKSMPLHVQLQQWWRGVKQFLMTPGLFGKLAASFFGSQKMPERELNDYLTTYITTQRMAREELEEDEEMGKIEDDLFSRQDWEKIMPRMQLEEIGEDYLNNVWCEVVTEYEMLNPDEDEVKKAEIGKAIFAAVAEASTSILSRHKKKLFGEEHVQYALQGSLRRGSIIRGSLKHSNALDLSYRGKKDLTDEQIEASVMSHLERRTTIKVASGATAASMAAIIEDLDQRVETIERRYACMADLINTIGEKIQSL